MAFACGIYHPDPVKDPDYLGPEFREDEVGRVEQLFLGKPVLYNHDQKRVIGKVTGFERGPHGHMVCKMFIDVETPDGAMVYGEIGREKLRGLSIGYDFKTNTNYSEFTHLKPIEISIVEQGAFDDTFIAFYGKGNEIYLSRRGMETLRGDPHNSNITKYSEMEAAPTTAPPAPAVPVALEPTAEFHQFEAFMQKNGLSFSQLMEIYPTFAKLQEEKAKAIAEERNAILNDPVKGLLPYVNEMESIPEGLGASIEDTIMREEARPLLMMTAGIVGTARHYKALYEKSQEDAKAAKVREDQIREANSMALRTEEDRKRPKPAANPHLESIRATIQAGLNGANAQSPAMASITSLAGNPGGVAEVLGRSQNSANTPAPAAPQAQAQAPAAPAPKTRLVMGLDELRRGASSFPRTPMAFPAESK